MFLSAATPPSALPFELEALKSHCRVEDPAEDAILELYAWAAIRQGEFATNRVWVQTEYKGELDFFPVGILEIPRSPCTEIVKITYVDENGVDQELLRESFIFRPSSLEWDGGRAFATIEPVGAWPVGTKVAFVFKSGWKEKTLPKELVQWIFIKVSGKFEQREDIASATRKIAIGFPRNFADALLDNYYMPKG